MSKMKEAIKDSIKNRDKENGLNVMIVIGKGKKKKGKKNGK